MSVNFFETDCKEPSKTDNEIGICDDQNGTEAYTDTNDRRKWIAVIRNDNNLEVTFTAIDNCIIVLKDETHDIESTCDGMITFTDSLYLVELKNQGTGGWIPQAIGQLENTIRLILANHNIENIKYKKAFACNKKHPSFTTIDNEKNKKFFKSYGFRIDAQAKIVIK